jgi:KipI family sensor histidine kinase inhibitor
VTGAVPPILPLGESAWTIVLGDRVDRALHRTVLGLARSIEAAGIPGVSELVPAYAALTVFCKSPASAEGVRTALTTVIETMAPDSGLRAPDSVSEASRLITIPTRYDGPDLDAVAERTGLTRDEVIRRHTAREYQVYLLGFAPGWAYLGELDPALQLPRRDAPRVRVPAGSVAIAGAQTGVYPIATPGGWHLLGTTDVAMFDRGRDPPSLLRPGDRVRFEAIS